MCCSRPALPRGSTRRRAARSSGQSRRTGRPASASRSTSIPPTSFEPPAAGWLPHRRAGDAGVRPCHAIARGCTTSPVPLDALPLARPESTRLTPRFRGPANWHPSRIGFEPTMSLEATPQRKHAATIPAGATVAHAGPIITFDQVRENARVKVFVRKADEALAEIGYTEHGERHVGLVAHIAFNTLKRLGYAERECELAA